MNGHDQNTGLLTELEGVGDAMRWNAGRNMGDPVKHAKEMVAEPGINLEQFFIRTRIPPDMEQPVRMQLKKTLVVERLRRKEKQGNFEIDTQFHYERMTAPMQDVMICGLVGIPSNGASRGEMVSVATMGFASRMATGGKSAFGRLFNRGQKDGQLRT